MAWETECLEILRVLINDLDTVPKYTDARLQRVLLVAAFQVNNKLDFTQDYVVNVQTSTLTPDPTNSSYREEAFVNLMCIKAACIIERGTALTSADQAISAREFSSSINLTGISAARQKLLVQGGWCPQYEEESLVHQIGAGVPGAAILTPFRTLAGYDGYGA